MPFLKPVLLAFSLISVLSACGPTTPSAQPSTTPSGAAPATNVSFAEIKSIVDQRCVTCHADKPTRAGFTSPAGGLSFETGAQIKAKADRINARVQTKTMPQFNVTAMTDAERELVRLWFEQGAKL